MKSSRLLEYRPPRIAMLLIIGAAFIHLLVPMRANYLFSSAWLAIVTGVTGFIVMMWAWWQFKERKVAIRPTDATEYLITDGVYRLTRNPMYLGMILILFGIAVFFGTLSFYVAVVAYFAIINLTFCPYEENKLTMVFGRDYETYKSQVRRWL